MMARQRRRGWEPRSFGEDTFAVFWGLVVVGLEAAHALMRHVPRLVARAGLGGMDAVLDDSG